MEKETRKRLLCMIACIIALCAITLFAACDNKENVKTDVTIEAGYPITLEAFFDVVPDNAMFLTDISGIDTSVPAIYQLKIGYGHNKEADVICRIEDHTGPTGEAVPVTIYSNWKMPEAADCVTYLYDLSGIAKIEYQEGVPNFSVGGDYNVPVLVTDVYGNSSVILVPFTIIDDHTAPVIMGVHDLELTGNPDGLDFFAGVTVTDDYDTEPVLKLDDSKVNYTAAGTYEIIYQAVDKAGNIGTAKANLKVSLPAEAKNNKDDNGEFYVGDGDPYALAQKVMAGLYRGSEVETARAIFNWVHDTLWFRLLSGTRTYESAAYRGFSRHNGDCYVYYACCKMLLDIAGIENMRVDRYPRYNGNIHYWLLVKLNGEWYHCDATEGYGDHPGIWFMCTDAQINDRYHQFNGSLYPMRAGGSKDYKPSPTPTPIETPTPTPDPNLTVTPTPDPNLTVTPTPSTTPEVTAAPTVTTTPAITETPEPTVEPPEPTEAPPDITSTPTEAPENPDENV